MWPHNSKLCRRRTSFKAWLFFGEEKSLEFIVNIVDGDNRFHVRFLNIQKESYIFLFLFFIKMPKAQHQWLKREFMFLHFFTSKTNPYQYFCSIAVFVDLKIKIFRWRGNIIPWMGQKSSEQKLVFLWFYMKKVWLNNVAHLVLTSKKTISTYHIEIL